MVKSIKGFLFALTLACTLVAVPAFALTEAEQAELMKDEDYKQAYEQYQAKMAEAKERLGAEEYARLEADNKAGIESTLEEMKEDVASGQLAEAYSTAYYGQFEAIDRLLLWDWLKKNPKGPQGLYFLQSDAFDGSLAIQEGDEPGMYAVTLTVSMKTPPNNSGELDGFGKLDGQKMIAEDKSGEEGQASLTFDADKVTITTTDAFKQSGWAGNGVIFDGVYVRQTAKN